MNESRLPLGKQEDQRLELKGRDALKDLSSIGREVVAMLNAEGGWVWVGIAEEAGRGVRVEPIDQPERARDRLRDFLADSVEPPLLPEEYKIDVVPVPSGGAVLGIEIKPDQKRKPYTLLKSTARYFPIRIGDRLRSLTREELRDGFIASGGGSRQAEEQLAAAEERAREARDEALRRADRPSLWLRFAPVAKYGIDLDTLQPFAQRLLEQPELAGLSPFNRGFLHADTRLAKFSSELRWGWRDATQVSIQESGALQFGADLEVLRWKGEPQEIWPPRLISYVVSAFRIAGAVYEEAPLPAEGVIVVEAALFRLRGWQLRAGTPGDFFLGEPLHEAVSDDLVLPRPLRFPVREIGDETHRSGRCSYRLLGDLYQGFDWPESALPQGVFDPQSLRYEPPDR